MVEEDPVGDPGIMLPLYSDKYKKMIGQMLSEEIKLPDAAINLINDVIKVTSKFSRKIGLSRAEPAMRRFVRAL